MNLERYFDIYEDMETVEKLAFDYATGYMENRFPDHEFSFSFVYHRDWIRVHVREVYAESTESFYELDEFDIPVRNLFD